MKKEKGLISFILHSFHSFDLVRIGDRFGRAPSSERIADAEMFRLPLEPRSWFVLSFLIDANGLRPSVNRNFGGR